MTTQLSMQINGLMHREMADLGPHIVKKKCKDIGIDPENITTENLIIVSKAISEAMASFGTDKSRKIFREINRLHNLDSIVNVEKDGSKKVEGLLELGDTARLSGEVEKAMEYYRRVLDVHNCEPRAQARAQCMIGTCLNLKNEPRNSKSHFEKAAEGASGDDWLQAMIHRGIGYGMWRGGDLAGAKREYEVAAAHAQKTRDEDLVGTIRIDLGMALENAGEYDASLASYAQAIKTLKRTGNHYNLARAHNNSGEIHKHREAYQTAIECYDLCREAALQGRNEVMVGYALGNSAECYAKMGALDKARECADKTMDIFSKRGDRYMMGGVHLTYGLIFASEGRKKDAVKHFEEAVAMMRAVNYPYEIGTHLFEYAKAMKSIGAREEARDKFREALGQFQRVGSANYIKLTEEELAKLD